MNFAANTYNISNVATSNIINILKGTLITRAPAANMSILINVVIDGIPVKLYNTREMVSVKEKGVVIYLQHSLCLQRIQILCWRNQQCLHFDRRTWNLCQRQLAEVEHVGQQLTRFATNPNRYGHEHKYVIFTNLLHSPLERQIYIGIIDGVKWWSWTRYFFLSCIKFSLYGIHAPKFFVVSLFGKKNHVNYNHAANAATAAKNLEVYET